jgi:hypothetical protein
VVRAEFLKTSLGCLDDVSPPEVPGRNLGGEEDFIPDSPERPPYDLLGAIGLSRINEGGTQFDAYPERLNSSSVFPGPQSKFGKLDTSLRQLFRVQGQEIG